MFEEELHYRKRAPLVRPARSFELYPETGGGPELIGAFTVYERDDYDARTLEVSDPVIDLAPSDKTPSTADLLEEGTPPSSPAPVVVSSPVVRNRAGSA